MAEVVGSMNELRQNFPDSLRVVKRDGHEERFDEMKVLASLWRAAESCGELSTSEAGALAKQVSFELDSSAAGNEIFCEHVSTESISDRAERRLLKQGHLKTARAYIAYREKKRVLRETGRSLVDATSSIEEYVRRLDWRVNANANQGYSLGGMILNVAGKVIANYWLNQIYPREIGRAHRDGDIHIHDLDMLSGYCAGWSLRTLLSEGFNGVPNKVESKPPMHFRTALGQMVNFLGTLQNEWAGAQAFSSFDTYLAPYVRVDKLSYAEIKQCMQEFVYNLNVPSRWGTQTPFTNLTFDWVCPDDLRAQKPNIGGRETDFRYGDLQEEMDLINRAYIEIMMEGDAKGRVFTFPIPTYNIGKDFMWDHPNAEPLFEMTAKYGLPYFQNFINSDLDPGMIRSMCCRLQLDLRELLKRGNGLFGSAEQTGSVGVVTVNCARLGYLCAGDEQALFRRLDELLELARRSLEMKREVVQNLINDGLFPYTRRYLGTLRNHFSTIGVNGVNECVKNFTRGRLDLTDPEGVAFAERLLDRVREKMVLFQELTQHMYNLEASPAEGATYRFAKEDKKRYPGIVQAGSPENPYYTNSSQLPVGATDDPFEALERQEKLQQKYTGGTVLHLYMNERISDSASCKNLVRRVLERFKLPYITVTPTFSICPRHGYLRGEHKFCPTCDKELLQQKEKSIRNTDTFTEGERAS